MAIQDKTVLVTGGAGFIGTALAERLLAENRVVVLDSFDRISTREKVFENHPRLTLIRASVLDREAVMNATHGVHFVVHLAAIVGAKTVLRSPTTTLRVNLQGGVNAIDAALASGTCERFVMMSTSEVFAANTYRAEETHPATMGTAGDFRPIYGVSKLASEHLTWAAYHEFGLPAVILRPFNVYGPGQPGENAMHAFATRALLGHDIEIDGDGDQIRSWIYIEDMVEAMLLALERDEAKGESFNIGNPRGTITIRTLADLVVDATGGRSRIVHKPQAAAKVEMRSPNIEKARRLLGFEPRVDLPEGIARSLEWYRKAGLVKD